MAEKYILELDRKEVIMLGSIVLSQKFYKSSYEPLKELCKKIDTICVEADKNRKKFVY